MTDNNVPEPIRYLVDEELIRQLRHAMGEPIPIRVVEEAKALVARKPMKKRKPKSAQVRKRGVS